MKQLFSEFLEGEHHHTAKQEHIAMTLAAELGVDAIPLAKKV